MALFGLLMTASGVLLAAAPSFPYALAALALGATSPTGTEVSPFLSVEQSIVADVAKAGRRTRAFAVYNLLGSLGAAAGALASGIPTLLAGGVPASPDPIRPMFLVYAVLGIMAAGLSLSLPASVELGSRAERVRLSPESRSRVARIALLFGVDSFAGGFVLQSFVALWFYTVYPESAPVLPLIFFAAGVLSAFSFLVAAHLGERFGLLETMVFTHLPSSLLLIAVPLLPGFLPALGAYLARTALSQMDVPTRQAYIAGIVAKEERTAANAVTNTARNVAQSAGPFSSGAVIAAIGSLAVPFLIGGGLKIVYDVLIFAVFRRIRPETL
jgi:predicted MFS family arabinose efflux permease